MDLELMTEAEREEYFNRDESLLVRTAVSRSRADTDFSTHENSTRKFLLSFTYLI